MDPGNATEPRRAHWELFMTASCPIFLPPGQEFHCFEEPLVEHNTNGVFCLDLMFWQKKTFIARTVSLFIFPSTEKLVGRISRTGVRFQL
jgi:hypothetical protein